jgi:hypothetical protein
MANSTLGELGELMPTLPAHIDNEARSVAQLGEELSAGKRRVFFYAASGLDWQPIHRFSHLCDCFVYVDPRSSEAEFEQARQQLVGQQTRAGDGLRTVNHILPARSAYEVLTEATGELAVMRDEPWTRIPNIQNRAAWGAVQRLKRHVGGTSRDLWLLFVAGSPLVAYERLFIGNATAPECLALCLPQFVHADPAEGLIEAGLNPHGHPPIEQQWSALVGRDGELGQLLRAHNAPLPNLLVADDPMAWPLHALWYNIPRWRNRWRTTVFTMRNDPWPDFAPVPADGRRRVVVTRRPINPLAARSVGAVVVQYEKFQQYVWPQGVLVVLSGPPMFPDQAVPDGPGVVNLNIEGIPLRRALSEVERFCAGRGITKVAIQGPLGYEDEADDLLLWRQQDGPVRELLLHVECDGHFLDYAPVASEID